MDPTTAPVLTMSGRGDTGDLRGSAAVGVRWGLVNQVVQQATKMVVTIVLTRLIAPEEFGVMALAMVVVNLGQLLNGLGFGPALVQRPQLTERHVRAALTGSLVFGLVCTGAAYLSAGALADFFASPDLEPVLAVLSVIFLAKSVESVPNDMLRRNLRFKQFVLSSTWAAVASAVAGVIAAAAGLDVWALVVYALVDAFVASAMAWRYAIGAGVWRPALGFHWQETKDLAGYSVYVATARVFAYVQQNGDNFAVGRVLGATSVGLYNLAYRVFLFPIQKVSNVLGQVATPAFAAVQHHPERLRRGYLSGLRYTSCITLPLSIGLCVTAPYFVPVVLGDRWLPAVATLQILTLSGPRAALLALNSNLWQGIGVPRWSLYSTLLTTPAFVVGIVVGVQHGIAGVALGVVIAGYVTMPYSVHLGARGAGTSSWTVVRAVAPVLGATALMAAAAWATGHLVGDGVADALRLVAMVVAGGITYLVGLRLLVPGLMTELVEQLTGRRGRRTGPPATREETSA